MIQSPCFENVSIKEEDEEEDEEEEEEDEEEEPVDSWGSLGTPIQGFITN